MQSTQTRKLTPGYTASAKYPKKIMDAKIHSEHKAPSQGNWHSDTLQVQGTLTRQLTPRYTASTKRPKEVIDTKITHKIKTASRKHLKKAIDTMTNCKRKHLKKTVHTKIDCKQKAASGDK